MNHAAFQIQEKSSENKFFLASRTCQLQHLRHQKLHEMCREAGRCTSTRRWLSDHWFIRDKTTEMTLVTSDLPHHRTAKCFYQLTVTNHWNLTSKNWQVIFIHIYKLLRCFLSAIPCEIAQYFYQICTRNL